MTRTWSYTSWKSDQTKRRKWSAKTWRSIFSWSGGRTWSSATRFSSWLPPLYNSRHRLPKPVVVTSTIFKTWLRKFTRSRTLNCSSGMASSATSTSTYSQSSMNVLYLKARPSLASSKALSPRQPDFQHALQMFENFQCESLKYYM